MFLPGEVTTVRAALRGCEGRAVCSKPMLLVERPAQAARTLLSNAVVYVSNCGGKQGVVLLGGEGVNPKAQFRLVGRYRWLGRDYLLGYMLLQARDKWLCPYT